MVAKPKSIKATSFHYCPSVQKSEEGVITPLLTQNNLGQSKTVHSSVRLSGTQKDRTILIQLTVAKRKLIKATFHCTVSQSASLERKNQHSPPHYEQLYIVS